ncbi:hypothetical protein PQR34_19405 [Paraburkholderia sediminicola]|uniref:hypothetical protein n=1 Tax=Paraburkholderia sediminicola TaxID=458836 RepID=UPI0038B8E44B
MTNAEVLVEIAATLIPKQKDVASESPNAEAAPTVKDKISQDDALREFNRLTARAPLSTPSSIPTHLFNVK